MPSTIVNSIRAEREVAASAVARPVADAVAALRTARVLQRAGTARHDGVTHFPSPGTVERAIAHLSAALYPRRLGAFAGPAEAEDGFVADQLTRGLDLLRGEIAREFAYWQDEAEATFDSDQADTVIRLFSATLGAIRAQIDTDIDAAFLGDPAARSIDEILVCYPGAIAVRHHRIAHEIDRLGAPIVARIISECANRLTGIDIHPGATIGPGFFIDHGIGVVIGETAIVGARVKLYQHVTLGACSPLGLAAVGPRERYARHPIIEDDVVIYAGATILGRVTIGQGSTIGGNVWLLSDVPPNSIVAQPAASVVDDLSAERVRSTLFGRGR